MFHYAKGDCFLLSRTERILRSLPKYFNCTQLKYISNGAPSVHMVNQKFVFSEFDEHPLIKTILGIVSHLVLVHQLMCKFLDNLAK